MQLAGRDVAYCEPLELPFSSGGGEGSQFPATAN